MIKHILAVVTAFTFAASAAQAQIQSQAAAGSNSESGAAAIVLQDFSTPDTQRIETRQSGSTTVKNVPSVSPASIIGGGHPCLSGQGGGLAVAGFGGSYSAGEAEIVCMLLFSGQHEAGIRALVMTNKTACKAIANVGYYIVPSANGKQKVVPFTCGETVKGGAYSASVGQTAPQVATVSTRSPVAPTAPKLFNTCYHDPASNQIKVKYTAAGRKDKARAAAACQRSLGF